MMNVATKDQINPFNGVLDVLGPTFWLFCENFWLITKIVFVIVAPFEIFKALSSLGTQVGWEFTIAVFLLDKVCKVLIAPALIYALMRVRATGKAPSVSEAYHWGFRKLGKLFVCAALVWTLQALGFGICIIPGIFVVLVFVLVYPIAILETGSPSEILLDSFDRTKEHLGKILVAAAVIWGLIQIISFPTYAVAELASTNAAFRPLSIATDIIADIIEQATTVLSLVIYLSIRALWRGGTQF